MYIHKISMHMVFFVFAPQKQAHHMIFLGHLFWEIMEQKKGPNGHNYVEYSLGTACIQ